MSEILRNVSSGKKATSLFNRSPNYSSNRDRVSSWKEMVSQDMSMATLSQD
jgi:hypothetical protein